MALRSRLNISRLPPILTFSPAATAIIAALKAIVPDGVVARRIRSFRLSTATRCPPIASAAGLRAAQNARTGRRHSAICRRGRRADRAARRGHLAVGRGAAARRRHPDRHGADEAASWKSITKIAASRSSPASPMLAITRAVEAEGFYYAPDPSSQIACTIGGNIAENSGGLHCLKYGLTTNNLLGVKFVLPDGEIDHPGRQGAGRGRAGSAGADHRLGRLAGHGGGSDGAHLCAKRR